MNPKREITAMIARTTPATMIPILAPDVILTLESFKRSGRVSMVRTNQKNAPAARALPMRDRREKMKTAALTGRQQQKYLRLPIVLSSNTR
jgi:hypothetical protein